MSIVNSKTVFFISSRRVGGLAVALIALTLAATVQAAQPVDPVQAWLNYERPDEYEAIVTEVFPEMRDGTRLGCHLAVPAADGKPVSGKFPGIISNVNPYAMLETFFIRSIEAWARRGYQGLTCRVRGSGESEGVFGPESLATVAAEWQDSYDLVEWLAGHDGSNGRIGQEGASYGGLTSYQAAVGQPPHLLAIAPQVAPADFYSDHIYPGGIKTRRFTVDNWPIMTWVMNKGDFSPWTLWSQWQARPNYDAYWDAMAVLPKLDQVRVPVLAVSGWDDHLFRRGALRNYEVLISHGRQESSWLLAGPWEHELMDMPSGMIVAWFDYWLKQDKTAPLPPARVISHEGGSVAGGWKSFEQWPPAAAEKVSLALTASGELSHAAGEAGVKSFRQHRFSGLIGDADSVEFISDLLPVDWVLIGDISLNVSARFTEPEANLYVSLFELHDGEERLIEEGWLKLSHRDSHEKSRPVVVGQPVAASVEIWPTHQRIAAGSQLLLKISGGSVWDLLAAPSSVQTDIIVGEQGSALQLTVIL